MQSHVDNKFPSLGEVGSESSGEGLGETGLGQGVLEKVLDEVLVHSRGPTKLDDLTNPLVPPIGFYLDLLLHTLTS